MGSSRWQRGVVELLHELREVESRMRRDYSTALELISELDIRDGARECGYPGLAQLLKDVLRVSTAEAKRRIQHANTVTEVPLVSGGAIAAPLPATAAALREGELGAEHVGVIAKTLSALPPHVSPAQREAAEASLVDAARATDPATLTTFATQLRAYLDQDGTPPSDAELAQPVNELRLATRRNGRLAFAGELDAESGALLRAVISPLAKPRPSRDTGPDPRSAAERDGDALVEILRLAADSGTLPSEAGEKPHLLVIVPLQTLVDGVRQPTLDGVSKTLLGGGGGVPGGGQAVLGVGEPVVLDGGQSMFGGAMLDGVGRIDAGSARRIACDARVIPAVLGAGSEVLDLGRASYIVNLAIRRALILRDCGCAFPGCGRPHQWCHAHHIVHWADGGSTSLDNLVLLCGHHHRLIHHSEWRCAVRDGTAEFRPPKYVDPEQRPRRNGAMGTTEIAGEPGQRREGAGPPSVFSPQTADA